jgi:hypothetical protein
LNEELELFVARRMAELMVEDRNRHEPDRAGELSELAAPPPFGRHSGFAPRRYERNRGDGTFGASRP